MRKTRFFALLSLLLVVFYVFPAEATVNERLVENNSKIMSLDEFSIQIPVEWNIFQQDDKIVFASQDKETIVGGSIYFCVFSINADSYDSNSFAFAMYDAFKNRAQQDNNQFYNYKSENIVFYDVPVAFASCNLDNNGPYYEGIIVLYNNYLIQLFYTDESQSHVVLRDKLISFIKTLSYKRKEIIPNMPENAKYPNIVSIDIANAIDNELLYSFNRIVSEIYDRKISASNIAALINISELSNEEIDDLISRMENEQINRKKAQIPVDSQIVADTITFRGIPWYSSRKEAEKIIGSSSRSKGPSTIYRMGAIDYDNVTWGSERVDDFGGCNAYYSGITIAGLHPSSTNICYIYPIIDGKIIRDDDLAQIYFGYYKFSYGDFGNHKALYEELKRKLDVVYGQGQETKGQYNSQTIWKDTQENYIRLLVNSDNNYVSLGYIAADANNRLDEMLKAIDNEKALEEEKQRIINEENYQGL